MQNDLIYLDPIPAIEVNQGEFSFYIFTIKAKALLNLAYTSERTRDNREGIQRGLRRDRLIEIGKYLQGQISGQPVLPNSVIISLSNSSYFQNGFINIADRTSGEAFIIDGQHRLWSFKEEFSNRVDFDIVVSAFIELSDDKKALIFKTINGEQRKINPSLVYDLIPMLKDASWVEFETWRSQEIVSFLDKDPNSPWAQRISLVGEAGKIISQASFMTAIKKLLKKGHIFNNDISSFNEVILQENILITYFKEIAEQYSVEWDNKDYLLCKYVGVSALLNLFEFIVKDLFSNNIEMYENRNKIIFKEDLFRPYITKLRQYSFSAKDAKAQGRSYVGEGGVNELFKLIYSTVF